MHHFTNVMEHNHSRHTEETQACSTSKTWDVKKRAEACVGGDPTPIPEDPLHRNVRTSMSRTTLGKSKSRDPGKGANKKARATCHRFSRDELIHQHSVTHAYGVTPEDCPIAAGWYYVDRSKITQEQLKTIMFDLTFVGTVDNFIDGSRPEPIQNYCLTDEFVCVPRAYGFSHFGAAGAPAGFAGTAEKRLALHNRFQGQLDEGRKQESAAAAVLKAWSTQNRGALLALPPGYGKTALALYLLSSIGEAAMIVCHTYFLLTQWQERIGCFLPDAKALIIDSKTSLDEVQGCDLALFTIQSYTSWMRTGAHDNFAPKSIQRFSTLVIDECHHYNARMFSAALPLLSRPRVLGLSGTPYRRDGAHEILAAHIGPITYTTPRVYRAIPTVKVVKPFRDARTRADAPVITHMRVGPGKSCINFSAMTNKLCDHPRRNDIIVQQILSLYGEGRVLVLSDRVNHLYLLEKLGKDIMPDFNSAVVHSGIHKKERKLMQSTCHVLFGTFGMYNEGLDEVNLQSIVLACPKKDVWQAISRCMRSQDCAPIIVDICDQVDPWRRCWQERLKLYTKEKYIIENCDPVPADDFIDLEPDEWCVPDMSKMPAVHSGL